MTATLIAAAAKWPIGELDAAWSTSPKTLSQARRFHLSGWAFYVAGRGGVLGDGAGAAAVTAALGLLAPDAVEAAWSAARAAGPVRVAASWLAECARWGDENLGQFPEAARLARHCERVVLAADTMGMALFAAGRLMPMPACGPGGAAAVWVHRLREHRAGALLLANRCCGLTPLEALIGGPDGRAEALTFGWHPPFPPRLPLLRRWVYAESLADRVCGQAYEVLTSGEQTDLIELLTSAAASVRVSPAG